MEEALETVASAANETLVQQTSGFIKVLMSFLTWNNLFKLLGAILVFVVLRIIYKLIIRGVNRVPKEKANPARQEAIKKFAKYSYYVILILYVLSLFGVKLSAIWGAAGIAGVAIGFAAQTSVSNIISGLFVLTEGSLKVGDTIIVGDVTGVVDSVSLLSVRVHTFDNQMVRIPNSTIINNNLINNSFHQVRRLTVRVSVAYNTDMPFALETLLKAPAFCEHVLKDPAPTAWFDGFEESGIALVLAIWFIPSDFITAKNEAYIAIKKVFGEAKIEIPYNKLDVMIKENV